MVDISKQVEYWQKSGLEDFEVARDLVENERIRHGLFFAHLSLEKLLKAHVCRKTEDIAPRIHNLVRLAEMAKLGLPQTKLAILAEMNQFNLEGRYPVPFFSPISKTDAFDYIQKVQEVLQWLKAQL